MTLSIGLMHDNMYLLATHKEYNIGVLRIPTGWIYTIEYYNISESEKDLPCVVNTFHIPDSEHKNDKFFKKAAKERQESIHKFNLDKEKYKTKG